MTPVDDRSLPPPLSDVPPALPHVSPALPVVAAAGALPVVLSVGGQLGLLRVVESGPHRLHLRASSGTAPAALLFVAVALITGSLGLWTLHDDLFNHVTVYSGLNKATEWLLGVCLVSVILSFTFLANVGRALLITGPPPRARRTYLFVFSKDLAPDQLSAVRLRVRAPLPRSWRAVK